MNNLFLILPILILLVPSMAFADHSKVTIEPASDSSIPGCEKTAEGCYIPSIATTTTHGTVIMTNTDTTTHTFTSGIMTDGLERIFDSGLLIPGDSFEWTPREIGEYDYFCLIHPWMAGKIIVEDWYPEHGLSNSELSKRMDNVCSLPGATEVYLNHTINNGKLKKICSVGPSNLYIEIEPSDDGFLILDFARDVFRPDDSLGSKVYGSNSNNEDYPSYRIYFNSSYMNYSLHRDIFWKQYEHLHITLVKFDENYQIYKIPFLKHDSVFVLSHTVQTIPMPWYDPQKYTMPIQKISDISETDLTTKETKFCKTHLTEILKPNNDKILCVKETTAEKLVLRGWIIPN